MTEQHQGLGQRPNAGSWDSVEDVGKRKRLLANDALLQVAIVKVRENLETIKSRIEAEYEAAVEKTESDYRHAMRRIRLQEWACYIGICFVIVLPLIVFIVWISSRLEATP